MFENAEEVLRNQQEEEFQLIVFELDDQEFTLPIMSVQEIIMMTTPNKLPKAPDYLEGVINLRNRIIPIIDGRKKFKLDLFNNKNVSESKIIVLNIHNETIGFIVDKVNEVIHLNSRNIEPPPVDLSVGAEFIRGVGKHKDRLLMLIDPEKILSKEESLGLKSVSSRQSELVGSIG
jgi:purine-binding chemotaxis protein CheW